MGLDMYLQGEEADGTPEDLGYWRKHPNLHGFIVQTFAGGVDECQRIDLDLEQLTLTLAHVVKDQLPQTSGFFFGTSHPEDRESSIEIIKRAIEWLAADADRKVFYRASW